MSLTEECKIGKLPSVFVSSSFFDAVLKLFSIYVLKKITGNQPISFFLSKNFDVEISRAVKHANRLLQF